MIILPRISLTKRRHLLLRRNKRPDKRIYARLIHVDEPSLFLGALPVAGRSEGLFSQRPSISMTASRFRRSSRHS